MIVLCRAELGSQGPKKGAIVRKLQSRLTYANVTATVALFIALGGGAYAAIDLVGRNDIKSRHIAPNQVKAADTSDKLRLECPGGTRYHEGACIETAFRGGATGVTAIVAETDCLDEERRLPTFGELASFRHEPDVRLGTAALQYEWTADWYDDGGNLEIVVIADSGGTAFSNSATPRVYRCVARAKS